MFSEQNRHHGATNRPSALHLSEEIANISSSLRPLMKRYDIRAQFSEPRDGLVVLDATRNKTSAYKVRGALASSFSAKQQGSDSVWTASAGNHGAGLAMAASLLGLNATVYVPCSAPEVKVRTIEGFGATVVRTGATFDECLSTAHQLQALNRAGSSFIHPFDDHIVAAGQGTLGLELFEHFSRGRERNFIDAVRLFVPIGGGGLIAGMAATLRERWNDSLPPLQIIGVVDESSPASLVGTLFGRPVSAFPDTIADGTKVARVGQTFLSVSKLVDFLMPVPHDAIVTTMRQHFERTNERLEPSGALALAGEALVRRHSLLPRSHSSLHYAVVSGRNVDETAFEDVVQQPSRLCEKSHCRVGYQVRVAERDGELLRFLNTVSDFNIASLTYKQRSQDPHGDLQVEFEVRNNQVMDLHERLVSVYPHSLWLHAARRLLLPIGEPVAREYRDELITLDDRAGAFRDYVRQLTRSEAFGSVGFLFYRQPSQAGSKAQVVIGRAPSSPMR